MNTRSVVVDIWADWMGLRGMAYEHEREIMNNLPDFEDWTIRDAEMARSLICQLESRAEQCMPAHPDSIVDYG